MFSVTMTARNGSVMRLEHVYVRGGQIKLFVLPELLKNAPIFKKVLQMKSKATNAELNAGNKAKRQKK